MTTHRVSIWHLLWQMIRYAQPLYWTDTLLWLFIAGLPALPGLIIREFFNTLTERSPLTHSAWVWIALFLAIGIARIIAIITGRITKTQHRFTMSALIRRNLLANLFQRPGAEPLTLTGKQDCPLSPGEVISFFREDAAQIEDNVVGTNEILGEGVFAIGSLLLLLHVNATITLFVFLPLVLIATIIHRIAHRIKRYRRASRQATQQVTGMIGEMFTAVQAIQVAGAEATVLEHLRYLCDRRRQSIVQDQLLTALIESSFENLVNLGTGAILFFAARSLQSNSATLTVGDFALFVYYLSFVTYFLSFLGSFLALTKQSEVSFERMEGLLGCNGEAIVAHHPLYLPTITGRIPQLPGTQASQLIKSNLTTLKRFSTPLKKEALTVPQRSLNSLEKTVLQLPSLLREARGDQTITHRSGNSVPDAGNDPLQELVALNLTYHYPGTNQGITDVSLRLNRGSFTVITGSIGSGKTTLLQVLMGLLPLQSGEIYWNGQRVEHPTEFSVPPRSAYTPQVPQLFSSTLRDNILLGMERRDEELQQAIALATFDRDLAAMPDGLETLVGSKGMRLSGGQLQRVAAARMFIRQPELLVFDDLSSALDIETEQALWSRLFSLRSPPHHPTTPSPPLPTWTPTCLVVSHRPAILQRADRILLLNHGRVELEGTFADLPSAYRP